MLYLLRHGETAWNTEQRLIGQQDVPLNETGRAQAHRLAGVLASVPFTAIYTSDLQRASETAGIIATVHGMKPIRERRLRECGVGAWEGHTWAEIAEQWPEELAQLQDDFLGCPPGGESLQALCDRATAALLEIVDRHPGGKIAIVGHGGSLSALIIHALGASLAAFPRLRLDNCSITTIRIRDDGLYSLTAFNDTCHLAVKVRG